MLFLGMHIKGTQKYRISQCEMDNHVMYLLDKLKPFEQKEHLSLKEQNGLGWNLAYVRKGPTCQWD